MCSPYVRRKVAGRDLLPRRRAMARSTVNRVQMMLFKARAAAALSSTTCKEYSVTPASFVCMTKNRHLQSRSFWPGHRDISGGRHSARSGAADG